MARRKASIQPETDVSRETKPGVAVGIGLGEGEGLGEGLGDGDGLGDGAGLGEGEGSGDGLGVGVGVAQQLVDVVTSQPVKSMSGERNSGLPKSAGSGAGTGAGFLIVPVTV